MTNDELAALERTLRTLNAITVDDESRSDAALLGAIIERERSGGERAQVVALKAAEQRAAKAERLVRMRDRQIEQSTCYWIRAGDHALAGDTGPLRNRIQMHREPPLEVSLSDASGAHLQGQQGGE